MTFDRACLLIAVALAVVSFYHLATHAYALQSRIDAIEATQERQVKSYKAMDDRLDHIVTTLDQHPVPKP